MSEQSISLASAEVAASSPGQIEDAFSEPRTPFNASSPASSSLSGSSIHPRPSGDWDIFPWHRFPNLTVSERRGRPKSWIWRHGYDLQEVKDETRHRWVCFECVRKKDPKITAHLASATANIETHLGNQHNIYGGKTQPRQGRKRSIGQMLSHKTGETTIADFQFRNSLKKQFDKDVFQRKLVRWIVQTNQSFRVAENETFRNMLDYLNPIISATNAHLSHDAIRRRVIEEYHFFRLHIIKTLHQSPSAIHIAFDGWTSRNRHPLFGIVAFFLDRNFRPQKIVLGLPNLTDRHTGENIAESVQNILETFELRRDKIGYFTLDNASNNDAAMERLAHGFQWACPMARRIRCFGHVVHLVARAMLLGKDDTSSVIEDDIDTEAHDAWLKRGPVGKLHNLMVWINRSNRVTEMLREAQRQDREKCWPGLLDVIVDNNTRWLSQFYMMSRAIKLRPYIEAVISDVRYEVSKPRRKGARQKLLPRCLEDDALLTEEDWQTIGLYQNLLRHFETCVKKLEGDGKQRIRTGGKEAAYGLMQDICPAYEWLMGHLEEAKLYADQTPELAHFRTNINLAWVKLNKYYSTIDQSPAYYAATVLHPAIRWDFLYRAYRQRPDWIEKSQELISGLWQEYKQFPVQFEREDPDDLRPMKKAKKVEVDSFSSYLDSFKSTGTAQPAPCEDKMDDELDRWLRLADPVEKDCDPFLYWFNKRFEYPRLTRMAIDVLSVPPMAAECERVFSSCGNMVSAKRCRLQAETIAITQTVKSWLRAGLLEDYDGLLKDLAAEEPDQT
jgi:hypothetical protein